MSTTTKTLLIIGGILLALILVSVIGIAVFLASFKGGVANNSVLVLRVSGELPEYVVEDPLAQAFGAPQNSFASLLLQIRKAKVDKRIGAIMLEINFPGIGWGRADDLREAIADFRTSGKPIYAYMELGTNKEYYIAAACDKVFLPPPGDLYVNGFALEAMFYRGTLDKIGIEPEVIQIGKYKNAPDQFTRKEMSPEHREVLNSIVDDLYNRFVNSVAEARKKTPDEIKALIDGAPYSAPNAEKLGLIDGAKYRDQVFEDLRGRLGYGEKEEIKLVSQIEYKEVLPSSLGLGTGEKIAVIFGEGGIMSGKSNDGSFGGTRTIGSDTLVRAIRDAADDTSIKAIVIRVDSGGGSALASDLIYHAVEYAKTKKPVVTSMSDVAASGGYYIACNSNKIIAQPSTITGSIGVFLGKPVTKGLYDWAGVNNEYILRGKNAGIFRGSVKWTPEERAKMEEGAKTIYYDNFIPKVAKGRNKTVEEIDAVGQGRVWMGSQAKERGLVDEFGGLTKAVEVAKGLANLPADKDVQRVVFPTPRPFFEQLFIPEDDSESVKVKIQQKALYDSLPKEAKRIIRFSSIFDQMKRGEAMLIMPYELEIK